LVNLSGKKSYETMSIRKSASILFNITGFFVPAASTNVDK